MIFMVVWAVLNIFTIYNEQNKVRESPFALEQPETGAFRVYEVEHPSPGDRLKEDQIHVYSDRIVIELKNAEWARFTDTNSMDPIIDEGAHAIEIVPKTPEEIQVGDIVSYESKYADGVIIHRVIETGYDSKGWYAVMKGDNLIKEDPGKIRFEQIKRVVVGILY